MLRARTAGGLAKDTASLRAPSSLLTSAFEPGRFLCKIPLVEAPHHPARVTVGVHSGQRSTSLRTANTTSGGASTSIVMLNCIRRLRDSVRVRAQEHTPSLLGVPPNE